MHVLVGLSRTGSGKTLAYLLPAFASIVRDASALVLPVLTTLIMAPTRELALQIEAECRRFGARLMATDGV